MSHNCPSISCLSFLYIHKNSKPANLFSFNNNSSIFHLPANCLCPCSITKKPRSKNWCWSRDHRVAFPNRYQSFYTGRPKWQQCLCLYSFELCIIIIIIIIIIGGSVAKWSARQTRSPAVPGLSPPLATCWICSRSSRVQILGHACK